MGLHPDCEPASIKVSRDFFFKIVVVTFLPRCVSIQVWLKTVSEARVRWELLHVPASHQKQLLKKNTGAAKPESLVGGPQ